MIKQPIGLKVYTNVSIVRLKIGKGRYEIACYPNKVQDYREKKEKDIKEVLQTREIFRNAIKGDIVPKKELNEVFPKMEHDKILELILEKGEIQTGEKEINDNNNDDKDKPQNNDKITNINMSLVQKVEKVEPIKKEEPKKTEVLNHELSKFNITMNCKRIVLVALENKDNESIPKLFSFLMEDEVISKKKDIKLNKKNHYRIEIEKLYDQNVHYKKAIKKLQAEINEIKNELDKKQKILSSVNSKIEQLIQDNKEGTEFNMEENQLNEQWNDQGKYNLIKKMKNKIKEAEKGLSEEILKNKILRRDKKFTKFNELEIERKIILIKKMKNF